MDAEWQSDLLLLQLQFVTWNVTEHFSFYFRKKKKKIPLRIRLSKRLQSEHYRGVLTRYQSVFPGSSHAAWTGVTGGYSCVSLQKFLSGFISSHYRPVSGLRYCPLTPSPDVFTDKSNLQFLQVSARQVSELSPAPCSNSNFHAPSSICQNLVAILETHLLARYCILKMLSL